ncbi:hypothetical protein ES705_09936 [subsurface metagenome]
MQERKNRGGPLRNRQVLGVVSDPEMKGGKFCRVCRARGRARLPEFLFGKKGGLKMKKVILLSVSILLISLAYSFAEVPCKINYQGRLIKDNVPVDGTKKMVFSIYGDAVGPPLLWTSGEVDVTVHNGLFRYVLDLSSIDDWTAGQELYLEVIVDGETLTPREELYSYPYAINSHLLEGETKDYFLNTSVETQKKDGGLNIIGNVGIGTTGPTHKLDMRGQLRIDQGSSNDIWIQGGSATSGTSRNLAILGIKSSDELRLNYNGEYTGGVRIQGSKTIIDGNVGIGTTSPGTNKLEVVGGPIKATGGLIIETRTSDPTTPATGQTWLRTD